MTTQTLSRQQQYTIRDELGTHHVELEYGTEYANQNLVADYRLPLDAWRGLLAEYEGYVLVIGYEGATSLVHDDTARARALLRERDTVGVAGGGRSETNSDSIDRLHMHDQLHRLNQLIQSQ